MEIPLFLVGSPELIHAPPLNVISNRMLKPFPADSSLTKLVTQQNKISHVLDRFTQDVNFKVGKVFDDEQFDNFAVAVADKEADNWADENVLIDDDQNIYSNDEEVDDSF